MPSCYLPPPPRPFPSRLTQGISKSDPTNPTDTPIGPFTHLLRPTTTGTQSTLQRSTMHYLQVADSLNQPHRCPGDRHKPRERPHNSIRIPLMCNISYTCAVCVQCNQCKTSHPQRALTQIPDLHTPWLGCLLPLQPLGLGLLGRVTLSSVSQLLSCWIHGF